MTLNMEKCDIFSLGMVMLKAYCGLTDDELKKMEINVMQKNESEINQKIAKALKGVNGSRYFGEVIKKMCNGAFQQRFKAKETEEFMF